MVLPPPSVFARILVRSGIAWGGMRVVVGVAPEAMRGSLSFTAGAGHPAVSASLLLIAIAAWLALFFGRRRNEPLFLANLGVGRGVIAGCALVAPVLGELAVRLVT